MPVYIQTAAELKGAAWAKRYPDKADELYVVARSGKRRSVRRFGAPTPENWAAAERKRDAWAAALERTDLSSKGIIAPLFEDAAAEYQRKGLRRHAPGTKRLRRSQFRVISDFFGDATLDQIDSGRVVDLYDELRDTRSERTSDCYLDALSNVYQWHEQPNPVPEARGRIAKKRPRTASARALNDANCNPVSAETMAALLPRLSGDLLTTTLLCYEAGLRIGEAVGLKWDDVTFGADDDDTRRSVLVQRSRAGKRVGRDQDRTQAPRASLSQAEAASDGAVHGSGQTSPWMDHRAIDASAHTRANGAGGQGGEDRAAEVQGSARHLREYAHHTRHRAQVDQRGVRPLVCGDYREALRRLHGGGRLPEPLDRAERVPTE